MSIIQEVAEWVHARTDGAISAEVAAAFSLTVSKASIVMGQIHREAPSPPGLSTFAWSGRTAEGGTLAASSWTKCGIRNGTRRQ